MKAPVFAYGSLEKLQEAVARGRIKYPTYCWVYDTSQYAFVNKEGAIEIAGLPKLTGTLDKQIILADLQDGVYEIKGQHKVTESDSTVYLSASYIIVIIASKDNKKRIRRITADNISDYVVENGVATKSSEYVTSDYLTEHNYVTEGYVDTKIEAMKISIEAELKDYVDSIIADQVAALVPEIVDEYVGTVPEDDIHDLFFPDEP